MKGILLGFILATASVPAATINVLPSQTTAAVGDIILVDVNIADVSDLYVFQFDVSFVPDVLSATGINDGLFLGAGGFFPGFIDNAAGAITFITDSLAGPISGVSGTGTFARISFRAIGPGTSSITAANPILLDSNLSDISVQLVGSQVTVEGNSPIIPEPSTVLLVLIGAAALIMIRVKSKSALRCWP